MSESESRRAQPTMLRVNLLKLAMIRTPEPQRIGLARGHFEVPDDIDAPYRDVVAAMLGTR